MDLPEEQLVALGRICAREGISRAEAIRRAVGLYQARELEAGEDGGAAFGLWKQRDRDALAYEAGLRSEWDRTGS